jgi:3-oxoadipate enol-lactonase
MNARINGIELSYQCDGVKGRPVVILLHGFPFDRSTWKAQVAALRAHFQVLTYDLRGMGQSGLGPAPQPLEAYVDDLCALMDHLRIAKAGLAGLSMGGYIALRAIQRQPQRFWALALCDTKAEADSDEGKLGRAAGIKALRDDGVKPFSEGMILKLLHQPKSAAGRGLLKVMLGNRVPGMTNALAAMQGRTDTTASLKALKVPVLVMAGQEDLLMPAAGTKALAQKIKGSQLKLLPKAGHVSNLEAPAAFTQALLGFFMRAYDRP